MKTYNQIGLLILCLGILTSCNNKKELKPKAEAVKLSIKSPLPKFDKQFQEFQIDNSRDTTIKLNNKGEIFIPKDAIVDENGKNLNGKINLKYREFHDGLDVMISGIPMDYHAQGRQRNMQTAGMFEIRAEQNGKQLGIDKNKKINVKMASFESGTDYSVFYLDQNGKGWEFLDYNYNVRVNADKEKKRKAIESKMKNVVVSKYFVFDYMAILDVVFENDYNKISKNQNNPEFVSKSKKYGLGWFNCYVSNDIVYKGVTMPAALMVWKKLSGPNPPSWLNNKNLSQSAELTSKGNNRYEVKIEVYDYEKDKVDSSKIYKAIIECVMPIQSLFKFPPEYWNNNYAEAMKKVEEEMKLLKFEADVYRSFEISGFGIYNYDKLMKEDNAVEVMAKINPDQKFKSEIGNNEIKLVYYLSGDNKTCINYHKDSWDKMVIAKDPTARLVTIVNGKIGVYGADKFKALNFAKIQSKSSLDFVLSKPDIAINSPDDLRNLLNF